MHQYSDHGRLNGYTGDLDLDLFYGTSDDWKAIARSNEIVPVPSEPVQPEPIVVEPTRDAIISQIMSLLEKLR